ncbi:MAG: bifunctional [glutamine synthetase] adenylyltransferase/[glutamine synthetase]-adenylyl-L-tyrosine phosphorylase [Alphaproteobacteria bacterium]
MPIPTDPDRTARLREAAPGLYDAVSGEDGLAALIDAAVANSPFLARTLARHADDLAPLLRLPPERGLARILTMIVQAPRDGEGAASRADLMAGLRRAKAHAATVIALADLGGVWSLDQVTGALSDVADAAVTAGVDWLLAQACAQGKLDLPDPDHPSRGSGYAVLAMGKHGARELNYSSDIDLVVFFDQDRMPVTGRTEPQRLSVAMTRQLVGLLQEMTTDGYVFRTDLRLRPDAGATQAAVSFAAAERYYEDLGQNWERAAFIKARAIAGDPLAGRRILDLLQPFIWRRNLDFAAIEDIHAIKRQIHAQNGHSRIAVEGHNLKLGTGGIREIEFFAQTQQLIAGGRQPDLRRARTVDALDALARQGIITGRAARELAESYRFLRTVEHRLQMVDDAQTHTLPAQEAGLAHIAAFMGLEADRFRETVRAHLKRVASYYAGLFGAVPSLSDREGNLVFTGVESDPDTLATLRRLGFNDPDAIAQTIRRWHHGRSRATRTPRAREILTKLVPLILDALAKTNDPDGAFKRFDLFLAGLPSGVQVFSLLQAHPGLLDLLADVLGMAPRFAAVLSRRPAVLDSLLDQQYLTALAGPHRLARLHAGSVDDARDFEEVLDGTRRFAQEQGLRIGIQILKGFARSRVGGGAHSDLAEAVIRGLMDPVDGDMAQVHGRVPGGSVAVVAMGKLGSRELTAASDLDLIFVYDHDGSFAMSDGPRPLHASDYFSRYCQRFINALTAPTAEGKFYEVDMRLRPSGRAGPIATRLEAFDRYHRDDAWTWEHMALTRARVVAGHAPLRDHVRGSIRRILTTPRDPDRVRADALEMRARMAAQAPDTNPWAVKTVRGGLIDLEFIAQVLQLIHAPDHPGVLHPTTVIAFSRLWDAGCLDGADAGALMAAARLQQSLAQAVTLALDTPFDPAQASPSLRLCLERAGGIARFEDLDRALIRTQMTVCEIFSRLVGEVPQDQVRDTSP